jgi:hypothetical protein
LTILNKDSSIETSKHWYEPDRAGVWFESDLPYVGGAVNHIPLWGMVRVGDTVPFTAQKLFTDAPFPSDRGSYLIINVKGASILISRDDRLEYEYLKEGAK